MCSLLPYLKPWSLLYSHQGKNSLYLTIPGRGEFAIKVILLPYHLTIVKIIFSQLRPLITSSVVYSNS